MNLKLNADRFTGRKYVNLYNDCRPRPPREIIEQSMSYLGKPKADLILDIGCGTGISTRILSDYGNKIIGLEPSEEMLRLAEDETTQKNVSYKKGYSNKIDLESKSVEVITCSQSFHWMEPISTLKEINRILKERGVLLIYDVIWPPSVNIEFELAYTHLFKQVNQLTQGLGEPIAHRWDKSNHLSNIESSNYFEYVKESYYHKSEKLSKEKFIGIALSQGGLEALLKRGFTEEEIGITKFRETIESSPGMKNETLTYNYRVIYGVRK